MHGQAYTWNFLVLNSLPYEAVLGLDLIHHSRIVIDLHNQCFFFAGNKKVVFPFENNPVLCMLQRFYAEWIPMTLSKLLIKQK